MIKLVINFFNILRNNIILLNLFSMINIKDQRLNCSVYAKRPHWFPPRHLKLRSPVLYPKKHIFLCRCLPNSEDKNGKLGR